MTPCVCGHGPAAHVTWPDGQSPCCHCTCSYYEPETAPQPVKLPLQGMGHHKPAPE